MKTNARCTVPAANSCPLRKHAFHFALTAFGVVCGSAGLAVGVAPALAETRGQTFHGEAYYADGWGVGYVDVHVAPDELGLSGPFAFRVRDQLGRIRYPAVDSPSGLAVLGIAQEVLSRSSRPAAALAAEILSRLPKIRVYFLFVGREPLVVEVSGPKSGICQLKPSWDERRHAKLLREWWENFCQWDRPFMPGIPEAPLLVEFMPYLEHMLQSRLRLPPPARRERDTVDWLSWVTEYEELFGRPAVGSMLGAAWHDREAYRPELATIIVSENRISREFSTSEDVDNGPIEPIACRVPRECAFIRFGNYSNFVWFQDLLARIGGDWEHLFRLRRWKSSVSSKVGDSLGLQQTVLARALGPLVVEDVALLLGDFDFEDGGTYALLFKARNDAILGADLMRQRLAHVAAKTGVTETVAEIAGRKVSLVSSSDGRIRSYYVAEDGYHFVSRSRRLVELFLEAAQPTRSLAQCPNFRQLRGLMPPQENDTVFIYLGPEFWETCFSPGVQIERFRRWQSLADLRLLRLAQLAAEAEGLPHTSLQQLQNNGFLPPNFGPRADGSMPVQKGDQLEDSLRGRPGDFPPTWDLAATRACPAELMRFRQLRRRAESQPWWGKSIGITLRWSDPTPDATAGRLEFQICSIGWQNQVEVFGQRLGAAASDRIVPLPGDGVFGEICGNDQRFFFGLRGVRLPWDLKGDGGRLLPLRDWVVGYWGSAPGESGEERVRGPNLPPRQDNPRFPRLAGRLRRSEIASSAQITRNLLGVWQIKSKEFEASSFQPELLAELAANWKREPADRPAQARLMLDDLSRRPVEAGFHRLLWVRAVGVTANQLRFLNWVEEQFRLPGGKGAEISEELFGSEFASPLGADYAWNGGSEGRGGWTVSGNTSYPQRGFGGWLLSPPEEGFAAPPLDWFRGGRIELLTEGQKIWISGTIAMEFVPSGQYAGGAADKEAIIR